MKKNISLAAFLLVFGVFVFAQEGVGDPNPEEIGVTSAQQSLQEVSVSKMEDPGLWYGVMSGDDGILQVRRFEGSPAAKEPIEAEVASGIEEQDNYVVGVKVSFFKRGLTTFSLRSVRPLPIEGITKTISVWVAGRNSNHTLEMEVADSFGNTVFINMGKLNFVGWKKLTVSVPPTVVQRSYQYSNRMGVSLKGFNIKCDLDETYGNFYVYFDDIRAVSDLFSEESRDADDIVDSW